MKKLSNRMYLYFLDTGSLLSMEHETHHCLLIRLARRAVVLQYILYYAPSNCYRIKSPEIKVTDVKDSNGNVEVFIITSQCAWIPPSKKRTPVLTVIFRNRWQFLEKQCNTIKLPVFLQLVHMFNHPEMIIHK